jgi:hypothetical protein
MLFAPGSMVNGGCVCWGDEPPLLRNLHGAGLTICYGFPPWEWQWSVPVKSRKRDERIRVRESRGRVRRRGDPAEAACIQGRRVFRADNMAETGCGDPAVVPGMATELFQLASLLVGSEERALTTIESALSTMQIDPCLDPESARQQARLGVVRSALQTLAAEHPASLATIYADPAASGPCIQDDDLAGAGITEAQMRDWQGSAGLQKGLRDWLESLPVAQRAVFVQRAVLGQGNEAAANLLREAGGSSAAGWASQDVSQTFRVALCSLANSLAHAPEHTPTADALSA